MTRYEDMLGNKFNMLTCIEFSHTTRKQNVNGKYINTHYMRCLCDCGNVISVSVGNLKKNGTKSCGCTRILNNKARADDLTGRVYGRLTVLSKSEQGERFWDCICSCGNTKSIRNYDLNNGKTISCGCFRKEIASNNVLTFYKNLREEQGLPPDVNKSSNDKIARARFIPLAREIYERDSFCCVWCSKTGKKLNAHHLETWSANPDKRFDKNNLVTLCRDCHHTVHNENWFSVPNPIMTILLQGYANVMEDGYSARIELTLN